MNTKPQSLTLLLILCILSFVPSLSFSAVTLYKEEFTNSTFNAATGNWRARYSTTAKQPASPYNAGITSGGTGPFDSSRYLFAQHQPAGETYPEATTTENWFLYSPGYIPSGYSTFSPNTYLGGELNVNWVVGSTLAIVDYYFAVEVDGNWYASSDMHTTTNANHNATPIDLLNSSWHNITLTTSALSLDTSSSSSFNDLFGTGQTITGIGFYIDNLPGTPASHRTIRFDNVTITGELVPEPSRALLLIISTLGLICHRRRTC